MVPKKEISYPCKSTCSDSSVEFSELLDESKKLKEDKKNKKEKKKLKKKNKNNSDNNQ